MPEAEHKQAGWIEQPQGGVKRQNVLVFLFPTSFQRWL
jgi:hypothetical protein